MSIPLMSPTIDMRYNECFNWKQLPMEMKSVNIAFCTENFDDSMPRSETFDGNVSNCFLSQKSKLLFKHIVGTMPYTCFVNVDSNQNLEVIHQMISDKQVNQDTIDKIISPDLQTSEIVKKQISQKLHRLLSLKTCIFTFRAEEQEKEQEQEQEQEKEKKKKKKKKKEKQKEKESQIELNKQMFYTQMNFNYENISHRLYIGKVKSIPKSTLSMCDVIFVDGTDTLNSYLTQMFHSLKISFSDFSTYVIDKRNYINSVVFSYDDVADKLYEYEEYEESNELDHF